MAKRKEIKNNSKRDSVVLKVQPQELNLTDLKELLEKSKSQKKEKDNKGKIIGYAIRFLGFFALIASLIINRLVDREYFPDLSIIFIMGVSILTLFFGFYILIRETY